GEAVCQDREVARVRDGAPEPVLRASRSLAGDGDWDVLRIEIDRVAEQHELDRGKSRMSEIVVRSRTRCSTSMRDTAQIAAARSRRRHQEGENVIPRGPGFRGRRRAPHPRAAWPRGTGLRRARTLSDAGDPRPRLPSRFAGSGPE